MGISVMLLLHAAAYLTGGPLFVHPQVSDSQVTALAAQCNNLDVRSVHMSSTVFFLLEISIRVISPSHFLLRLADGWPGFRSCPQNSCHDMTLSG